MNVFEDLVVELKEENLLENTFIDMPARPDPLADHDDNVLESEEIHPISDPVSDPVVERFDEFVEMPPVAEPEPKEQAAASTEAVPGAPEFDKPVPVAHPGTVESADIQFQGNDETIEIRKAKSDREFFKKRAVSEMSSLKMVEAVLSAVEREHLKVVPRTYDDLEAKKALHAFMQAGDDITADEHKQSEFKLLHETELWCSALAARDKDIAVGHLRRYCETCRPMLSSQALLALARFYRNLPYSEAVRGKFDFIITRLFSRPVENETRKLLFNRNEMLGHVRTLYADWSSIPLYSAEEDESKVLLTALSFEELSVEAESAPTFDDLIKSDFFGRLRLFKESIAELFFAPVVTAAAIECNVRIGNVYVALIDRERLKMDNAAIHERFGEIDDQVVSEAAARTLELVDILRERPLVPLPVVEHQEDHVDEYHAPAAEPVHHHAKPAKADSVDAVDSFITRLKANAFSINRWFLVASVLIIAASVGIFVWGNYYAEPAVTSAGVKTLSFAGTDFADNIKVVKLSGDTLYVVLQPGIDGLPKDKQTELLQKLALAGKEKGWSNVNLMNSEGRTIGYSSPTRLEITGPQ